MKARYKYGLLVAPFLLIVIANEFVRPTISEKAYGGYGVTFMNPELWVKDACSWACHNSSKYCEKHHISYMRPLKQYIDPVYFGIIGFLKKFPNYGLANIICLVIGWPLLMWFLIVKCIEMRNRLKTKEYA